MSETIKHSGIIKAINGYNIQVEILAMSACGSCQAKSMCGLAEKKEKIIDVYHADAATYQIGEEVNVCMQAEMGLKAAFWAYGMNALLMMAVLFLVSHLTGSQVYGAIAALLAVALYYLILKLFSKTFDRKFRFYISKIISA